MTAEEWHYVVAGSSKGPFSTLEMEGLIARGDIRPETLVWHDGLPVWEPAAQHFSFVGGAADRPGAQMMGDGLGPDGLYRGAPSRGFMEALQVCMSRYASFAGRASRSEYWYFVLWQVIFGAITGTLDALLFPMNPNGILNPIVSLALLLPTLAVSWRRLHDINRSGWWIGGFYLLLVAVVVLGIGAYGTFMLEDPSGTPDAAFGFGALVLMAGVVVYGIVMLVFYCTRGTLGPNRYG